MSYEECPVHKRDATNGCPDCWRDRLKQAEEHLRDAALEYAAVLEDRPE